MLQDLTGQMVGHYQVIRPIEQGGMATVCLASDIHLRREVAIKVFQSQREQEHSSEFSRRFTREAQIVARLDHPNILLVYDYGEQDSLAYLVMPYLSRGSLKNLLKERGRLPVVEALRLIFQLLDALQYAHDRKLIHRDIKPGNILFKNDQTPVLADFGLVKEMVTGNTGEIAAIGLPTDRQLPLSSGRIMGTPYYMAPEQIRGQAQAQSDIYSIGLVLYEMLTGQLPFTADTQGGSLSIFWKQMYEAPRPIAELNPSIPPQLAAAIMHALEKDADRRYQSPADFSQALRVALNVGPLPDLESPLLPDRYTDDADSNETVPVSSFVQFPITPFSTMESSQESSQSLQHTGASLVDVSNGAVAAIPRLSQRVSRAPLKRRFLYLLSAVLVMVVLVVLIFARPLFLTIYPYISNGPPAKNQSAQHPSSLPMPATQITCPQAGKARAAVLVSYQAQAHNAVVYAVSQEETGKESSTLMRYDTVTGKSSRIVTVPDLIANAQISGDGQWVIFSTYGYESGAQQTSKPSQIQMVRMDGQGLQTLYCTPSTEGSFQYVLASPGMDPQQNGWQLFFVEGDGFTMGTLNIVTGNIQQQFSTHHSYQPITWLNDQDLYLLDKGIAGQDSASSTPLTLDLLNAYDTLSPSNPDIPVAINIPGPFACSDVDFSPDYKTLFISHCQGNGAYSCSGCAPDEGPSSIDSIKQDTEGNWGNPTPLFTSSTQAITGVRAVTSTSVLFQVENDDQYNNQNGIWKINTDGSGSPQRLTTEQSDPTVFNSPPQYTWSNVSRNGGMYALKTGAAQSLGYDKLFIGSLNGGQSTTIAEDGAGGISHDSQLAIVGWTTD